MVAQRMDKTAFLKALGGRSAEELKTLLWTVYWRGTAPMRERIEDLLAPQEATLRRAAEAQVDPELCLQEVETFCERARAGDYLRGARDLGRKEVSGWRFTFRRLFDEACRLLEQKDLDEGSEALEGLVDFADETQERDFFRSEDPVEAARIVLSDRIETLWRAQIQQEGFAAFLQKAPAQLLRWEQPYGWTRSGGGPIAEKERQLAEVLPPLLPGTDGLLAFCRSYLAALNDLQTRKPDPKERKGTWNDAQSDFTRTAEKRSRRLEAWHAFLLARLQGTEEADILQAILEQRAVQGPETWCLLGRLRQTQGRIEEAQTLVKKALARQPGNPRILDAARQLECGPTKA